VLDESSPTNGDRMMGFARMERDTATASNLAVNRVQNPRIGTLPQRATTWSLAASIPGTSDSALALGAGL
jgi:hypothetical protein